MKQLKTTKRARRVGQVRQAGRARRDGDTEQRILDAAHTIFVRRGTAGARMQEIAAEARVNQALLHYYFRTKEHLARAAFERAAIELMPAVIRLIASDAELEDKVVRIVDLYLDRLTRAPYLPGYVISEVTHHPERVRQLIGTLSGLAPEDIRSRVFGALQAQIDARVARGAMQPIAPQTFMVNLMSLCIFPFAAAPMLKAVTGMDDAAFAAFIDNRRRELPAFFLGALRP
jgi:AcrR family transcriptional regulator